LGAADDVSAHRRRRALRAGPDWTAIRRGIVSCSPEPFGGAVGGALELLESSEVRRAAAVEPRSIEVEALAVVVRLRAKLL
jgi:hypothetical protein